MAHLDEALKGNLRIFYIMKDNTGGVTFIFRPKLGLRKLYTMTFDQPSISLVFDGTEQGIADEELRQDLVAQLDDFYELGPGGMVSLMYEVINRGKPLAYIVAILSLRKDLRDAVEDVLRANAEIEEVPTPDHLAVLHIVYQLLQSDASQAASQPTTETKEE